MHKAAISGFCMYLWNSCRLINEASGFLPSILICGTVRRALAKISIDYFGLWELLE